MLNVYCKYKYHWEKKKRVGAFFFLSPLPFL